MTRDQAADTRPTTPLHKRRPLVETVAEEITRIILNGELRSGEKLNELEIAQRLGVSRGPVREASRQLMQQGLLETHAFRGAFVRSLSQREVAEVYALRALLEGAATVEAARLATPADLAVMERALADTEMAALANAKDRMIEADVAFHTALCAAGHNDRITETFGRLAAELRLVHLLISPTPRQMRASADAHGAILAAIRSRRSDRAAGAVRSHIDDERDEVLQHLGPHGGAGAGSPAGVPGHEIATDSDSDLRVSLRPHVRADLPLLARMNRELADDEGHRNPMSVAEMERRFVQFVDREGWSADLFLIEAEVIGYAVHRREPDPSEPSGRRIFLRQFFIARHRRGGGIGLQAFELLKSSRFEPGERIFLEAIEDNPGGRVFWLRAGFTPYSSILERVV